MSLLAEMAGLLPGRLSTSGNSSRLVFEIDGCWLDARAREAPMIEVFIRTLDLPGFELEVEPGGGDIRLDIKRHWVTDAYGNQAPVFDDDEIARAVAAATPALSFE